MPHRRNKLISLTLCLLLLLEQTGFAQTVSLNLSNYLSQTPKPAVSDTFRPLHLRYLSYDNSSNNFQLLLDKGSSPPDSKPALEQVTQELLKYFFIGLALPNDKFWVNLRPDSPDDILDPDLEKTDIGRIFLEADVQLKQDTSGLTSPQTKEGKEYWDKLYKKAGELFGSENITIPTLTRPWIVPDEVILRESPEGAYIYKATLKVMLEEDYLRSPSHQVTKSPVNQTEYSFNDPRLKELNEYSTQLIKEAIIPKLTRQINTSKRYAPLRQVYYSLILAQWFKQSYQVTRSQSHQLPQNPYIKLIDSGKLITPNFSLLAQQPYDKQANFKQYQQSFQDGEYNLQEPVYTPVGQSIRRYVSGGITMRISEVTHKITGSGSPMLSWPSAIKKHTLYFLAILPLTIFSPEISVKAGELPVQASTPEIINYASELNSLLKNLSAKSTEEIEQLIEPAIAGGPPPLNHSRLKQADYIGLIPLIEGEIGTINMKETINRKLIQLIRKCYQEKHPGDMFKYKEEVSQLLRGLKDKIQKNENEETLFLWDSIIEALNLNRMVDPSSIIDGSIINKVHKSFREYFFNTHNSTEEITYWLKKYLEYGENIIKIISPNPESLKEIILSGLPYNIKYTAYTNTIVPFLEETVKNENNITRVLKALAWLTHYHEYKDFYKLIEETLPQKSGNLKTALQIILHTFDKNNPNAEESDLEIYTNANIEIVRAFYEVNTDIAKVHILSDVGRQLSQVVDLKEEFITEKTVSLLNLLEREESFTKNSIVILEMYDMLYKFFSKSSIKFQMGFIARTASLDAYSGGNNPEDREKMALFETKLLSNLKNIYEFHRKHWDSLIEKLVYRLVDLYQGRFSLGDLMKVFTHSDFMAKLKEWPYIDAWSLAMACVQNMEIAGIEYKPENIAEVINLTMEGLKKKSAESFFNDTREVIIVYDEKEERFVRKAEEFRKSAEEAKVAKITFIPVKEYEKQDIVVSAIGGARGKVFFAYFGHGDYKNETPGYSAGLMPYAMEQGMADYFKHNGHESMMFIYSDACYSLNINMHVIEKILGQASNGNINLTAFSSAHNEKTGVLFEFPVGPDTTVGDFTRRGQKEGYNDPAIIMLDPEIGNRLLKLSNKNEKKGKGGRIPILISSANVVNTEEKANKRSDGVKIVSSAFESENPSASSAAESVQDRMKTVIRKIHPFIKGAGSFNDWQKGDDPFIISPGTIIKRAEVMLGERVKKTSLHLGSGGSVLPIVDALLGFSVIVTDLNMTAMRDVITIADKLQQEIKDAGGEIIFRKLDLLKLIGEAKYLIAPEQEEFVKEILSKNSVGHVTMTNVFNWAGDILSRHKERICIAILSLLKKSGGTFTISSDMVIGQENFFDELIGIGNKYVEIELGRGTVVPYSFILYILQKNPYVTRGDDNTTNSSSAASDDKGGIDLSRINKSMRTESVSSPGVGGLNSLMDVDFDVNEELIQLQKLLNAQIIPSADRLNRYARAARASSVSSPDSADSALSLVAETFRLQEEKAVPDRVGDDRDRPLQELAAWLEQET